MLAYMVMGMTENNDTPARHGRGMAFVLKAGRNG